MWRRGKCWTSGDGSIYELYLRLSPCSLSVNTVGGYLISNFLIGLRTFFFFSRNGDMLSIHRLNLILSTRRTRASLWSVEILKTLSKCFFSFNKENLGIHCLKKCKFISMLRQKVTLNTVLICLTPDFSFCWEILDQNLSVLYNLYHMNIVH